MKKLFLFLIGFLLTTNAFCVETIIPQGDGTTIGNMIESGGLAAAFDGVTAQAQGVGSKVTGATNGFAGKDWGAGVTHTVTRCKAWSSDSDAWSTLTNLGTLTATVQGSTDNFSASIVDLGSNSSTMGSTAQESINFVMTDTTTAYRYHRIKLASSNGTENWVMAEVEFYEDTGSTANFMPLL